MFHGGVCALAVGISIVEAVIENVKSAAIRIAIVLLFSFCIFIFLQFYFLLSKKHKCARSIKLPSLQQLPYKTLQKKRKPNCNDILSLLKDKLKKKEVYLMFWYRDFFLSISKLTMAIGPDRLYAFCPYCYVTGIDSSNSISAIDISA